jgi:uncharacterized YigZ family protein
MRRMDMIAKYREVYQGGQGEIVEKKSRFIANVSRVTSEEEAVTFIERMKKQYWDARHNCSAFSIGVEQPIYRCSDDGEPSGTAGKPMLEVILGEEIHNIVVVVTRYFGGTLLGTGGLVRAYTQATQAGIENSEIIEKTHGIRTRIETNYTDIGKIQYILAGESVITEDTEYTDQVVVHTVFSMDQKDRVEKLLVEATSGRVIVEYENQVYFAILEDGNLYMEEC